MTKQLLLVTSSAFCADCGHCGIRPNAKRGRDLQGTLRLVSRPRARRRGARARRRAMCSEAGPYQQICCVARAWRQHGRERHRVVDGGETSRRRVSLRRRRDHRIRSGGWYVRGRRGAAGSSVDADVERLGQRQHEYPLSDGTGRGPDGGRRPEPDAQMGLRLPRRVLLLGQPTVAAGRIFIGNINGHVYSLDAKTGCTHWTFKAERRAHGDCLARHDARRQDADVAMFGDVRANAYAIDAESGRVAVEDEGRGTPAPRASPARRPIATALFVPGRRSKKSPGARPNYPVLHLPRQRGRARRRHWQADLEDLHDCGRAEESARPPRAPHLEVRRRGDLDLADDRLAQHAIYVATGNAYTEPAAPTSDAVMALDMTTGTIHGSAGHT